MGGWSRRVLASVMFVLLWSGMARAHTECRTVTQAIGGGIAGPPAPVDGVTVTFRRATDNGDPHACTTGGAFGPGRCCVTLSVSQLYNVTEGTLVTNGVYIATEDLVGGGGGSGQVDNMTATRNPTLTDDTASLYTIGSRWKNTSTGEFWIAVDVTSGAARWVPITDVWDVTTFGAKCDGTTTDTTALRNAAATVPDGATLFLPASCLVAPSGSGPMIPVGKRLTVVCRRGVGGLKIKDATLVSAIPGMLFSNWNAAGSARVTGGGLEVRGCTIDGNDRGNSTPGTVPALFDFDTNGELKIADSFIYDVTGEVVKANLTRVTMDNTRVYLQGQATGSNASTITGAEAIITRTKWLSTKAGLQTSSITLDANDFYTFGANAICDASGVPFACCTGVGGGSSTGLCAAGVLPTGVAETLNGGRIVARHNTIDTMGGIVVTNKGALATGLLEENWIANPLPPSFGSAGAGVCIELSIPASGGSFGITGVEVLNNYLYGCGTVGAIRVAGRSTMFVDDITMRGNTITSHGNDFSTGTCPNSICAAIVLDATAGQTGEFNGILIESNLIIHNLADSGSMGWLGIEGPTHSNPDSSGVIRVRNNTLWHSEGGGTPVVLGASRVKCNGSPTIYEWTNNGAINFTELTELVTNCHVGDGSSDYCSDCAAGTLPCTGSGSGSFWRQTAGQSACEVAKGVSCTGCVDLTSEVGGVLPAANIDAAITRDSEVKGLALPLTALADHGDLCAGLQAVRRNSGDTSNQCFTAQDKGTIGSGSESVTNDCNAIGMAGYHFKCGPAGTTAVFNNDIELYDRAWDGSELAPFRDGFLSWVTPSFGTSISTVLFTCWTDQGTQAIQVLDRQFPTPNSGGATMLADPLLCDSDGAQSSAAGATFGAQPGDIVVVTHPTNTATPSPTPTKTFTPLATPTPGTRTPTPTLSATPTITATPSQLHFSYEYLVTDQ